MGWRVKGGVLRAEATERLLSPRDSRDAEELLGKRGHEDSNCLSLPRLPRGGFPKEGLLAFFTSCRHTGMLCTSASKSRYT